MRYLLFFSLIFLLVEGRTQDVKRLDQDNGFRDLHFGDSLSKLPEMKIIDQAEDSAYIFCKKINDSLKIEGADVDLVYTFYKRQLATVFIQTKGQENSRKVLKYLEGRYGKGGQEDKYLLNFFWDGHYVRLTYREHVISYDAKIHINSLVYRKVYKGPQKQE